MLQGTCRLHRRRRRRYLFLLGVEEALPRRACLCRLHLLLRWRFQFLSAAVAALLERACLCRLQRAFLHRLHRRRRRRCVSLLEAGAALLEMACLCRLYRRRHRRYQLALGVELMRLMLQRLQEAAIVDRSLFPGSLTTNFMFIERCNH